MARIGEARVGESRVGDLGWLLLSASGSGTGSGSATLTRRVALRAAGAGTPIGEGKIGEQPIGGQVGGGEGVGTGTASLGIGYTISASGSGTGTGTADLARGTAIVASGSGVGSGTAALTVSVPKDLSAAGVGIGVGTALMYGVDSPVSWTVHLKNESDVEADAVTSDWPQITRGQTTTVRLWIDDREGEWDRLHDLLDWADAAAYGQGIDHTPWYREQLPSGADVDSIVVGVEPAQKLLDRDVEGVWGIVVGGRDTRNAPLTNWTLELDLLVLAEAHEYDTHSEIESAFEA